MTLINLRDFPPGGYPYREPNLNWEVRPSSDLALQGLEEVAKELSKTRARNPHAGLNPSLEACLEDIKKYTCARLMYDPRFCADPPPDFVGVRANWLPQIGSKPCFSCGRK